jgi:thymidine kinase
LKAKTQIYGRIEVICGGMFSGKTEELIRRLRRAEIARLAIAIFKPQLDTRFKKKQIISHNKTAMNSTLVNECEAILNEAEKYDVIGIDEAQFFDNRLVKVCQKLANMNKRVIVAGLDKDFKGSPFGPMPYLMAEADYLDKLRAICTLCGRSASNSQRMTEDIEKVVIGELDIYEARCRSCFNKPPNI